MVPEMRLALVALSGTDSEPSGGKIVKSNLVLMPAIPDLHPLTPAVLYEVAAAKYLKIAIEDFREFVNQGLIPFRTHPGRSRRIYLKADLDIYLKNLPIGKPTRRKMDAGEDPSEP
jgi:hypothetical protein